MPDIDDIFDDEEDTAPYTARPFYIEGTRPVDRLPPVGQQLADAWLVEHGDDPFPE